MLVSSVLFRGHSIWCLFPVTGPSLVTSLWPTAKQDGRTILNYLEQSTRGAIHNGGGPLVSKMVIVIARVHPLVCVD